MFLVYYYLYFLRDSNKIHTSQDKKVIEFVVPT